LPGKLMIGKTEFFELFIYKLYTIYLINFIQD
jgi:hypothetical protein